MKNFWLVVVLFACGVFASAQTTKEYPDDSGNAFLGLCSTLEKGETTAAITDHELECVFYIKGFVSGVEVEYAGIMEQTTAPIPFCRPENTENGQLVKIVLKYIRQNPKDAHQPTKFVAMRALQKAFPCPFK